MDKIRELNRGFQFIEGSIMKLEQKFIKESGLDITRRELIYIVVIHDNERKTMTELLKATTVTKATLSNQIKVIVKKGYAKLYIDKVDSRKKRIKLTKKGKVAYELHEQIRKEIREDYKNVLTTDEIEHMVVIGRKIMNHIKESENVK